MPSSKRNLELLVRTKPLTDKEWLALVEERREMFLPYLDKFTLPVLGDIECLRRDHRLVPTGYSVSVQGDEEHGLKTQGIFRRDEHLYYDPGTGFQPMRSGVSVPNGFRKIWGLTRNGNWIVATITYTGHPGYKDRGEERAERVEIKRVMLEELLASIGISAEAVLNLLDQTVNDWVRARWRSYEEMRALSDHVHMERILRGVIEEHPIFPDL